MQWYRNVYESMRNGYSIIIFQVVFFFFSLKQIWFSIRKLFYPIFFGFNENGLFDFSDTCTARFL